MILQHWRVMQGAQQPTSQRGNRRLCFSGEPMSGCALCNHEDRQLQFTAKCTWLRVLPPWETSTFYCWDWGHLTSHGLNLLNLGQRHIIWLSYNHTVTHRARQSPSIHFPTDLFSTFWGVNVALMPWLLVYYILIDKFYCNDTTSISVWTVQISASLL